MKHDTTKQDGLTTNDVLLYAYLDISHTLLALEQGEHIDTKALKATLDDIREVYRGGRALRHERDKWGENQ